MKKPKPNIALEVWMGMKQAVFQRPELYAFCKECRFDPKKVVAECNNNHLICVAVELGLYTLCVQLGIDVAKVVAHLYPDPSVQAAIEAAEKCVVDRKAENIDAARAAAAACWDAHDDAWSAGKGDTPVPLVAGWAAVAAAYEKTRSWPTGDALRYAYEAVKDHPELTNNLDALVAPFRVDVHNALMAKLKELL